MEYLRGLFSCASAPCQTKCSDVIASTRSVVRGPGPTLRPTACSLQALGLDVLVPYNITHMACRQDGKSQHEKSKCRAYRVHAAH